MRGDAWQVFGTTLPCPHHPESHAAQEDAERGYGPCMARCDAIRLIPTGEQGDAMRCDLFCPDDAMRCDSVLKSQGGDGMRCDDFGGAGTDDAMRCD